MGPSSAIKSLAYRAFWAGWEDRFTRNTGKFITPQDPLVIEEANKINVGRNATDVEKAKKVWLHVREIVRYKLSKKWKTPREAITSGTGDCEDMDFLMISMLPHLGVGKADLVIGNLILPIRDGGPHTWVKIQGNVMDPTGSPEDVKKVDYEQKKRFEIRFNGENNV